MKKIFFTIFTMLIWFFGVFNIIYVKISLHVTVPLRGVAEWLQTLDGKFHYHYFLLKPPIILIAIFVLFHM